MGQAMTHQEESQLAERQIAFLRQLPRRVEVIGRRFHRFMSDGWDINGLALIHEDSTRLARSCKKQGLEQAQASLDNLSALLFETLQQQSLPDLVLTENLLQLIEDLGAAVPAPVDVRSESAPARAESLSRRAETPPPGYWRRWGDDAPAPSMRSTTAAATTAPSPVEAQPQDPWSPKATLFGSLSSSGASFGKSTVVESPTSAGPVEPVPLAVPPNRHGPPREHKRRSRTACASTTFPTAARFLWRWTSNWKARASRWKFLTTPMN